MAQRLRAESLLWVVALAGVAVLAWLGLQDFTFTDYDTEVSAPFRALIDGDLHAFLAQLPIYGGSLILRAPVAAATAALGGGEVAVYRAVSIPGLLAVAVLGIALARRMRALGAPLGARVLVVALCAINPITLPALEIGHPEELLCAAFAIGAVLAASDGRALVAGALLGLAIATKAWAVLAIGPTLLALPDRRLLALSVAGAVTALVTAPILLAGSADHVVHGARQTGLLFNPQQLWWPLGDVVNVGLDASPKPGARFSPAWLSPLTHPLIAGLVVPLSALWWGRHRREAISGEHLLGLLALLLLLRCILDPWNTVYYGLPFLLALLAWEALTRGWRPPVLTLGATVATWVSFKTLAGSDPNLLSAVYLAWALPLAAWLAHACLKAPLATTFQGKATQASRSTAWPLRAGRGSAIAARRGR